VFVNGKRLVKDGKITSVDVKAIIEKVKLAAEKIGRGNC
jgi:hypothetical protein